MNIFKKIWKLLKETFVSNYKKEFIEKDKLIKFLNKSLPNKKKCSVKDVVDKIKDFCKK